MTDPGSELRAFLTDSRSHLVVSAYDSLTAKLADAAGFEILHLSGFAASASLAGVPDIGLLTMSEMVDACRRICEATGRPVIADADTGYGDVLNVRRTVKAFESAGAAGVHLEDQTLPKRCGHMAGKKVISIGEMVGKIRAAVEARRDSSFVIIARTDARAVEGLEAAIQRAHAYREAGADVLFVEAPRSEREIEQVAQSLDGPLLFNWAFDGVTPHVSRTKLEELGFALILFTEVASAVHHSLRSFFERLSKTDSFDELESALTRFDEFNNFLGLEEWRRLESRYLEKSIHEGSSMTDGQE
jgi:2,3-dimethylmalate lyase